MRWIVFGSWIALLGIAGGLAAADDGDGNDDGPAFDWRLFLDAGLAYDSNPLVLDPDAFAEASAVHEALFRISPEFSWSGGGYRRFELGFGGEAIAAGQSRLKSTEPFDWKFFAYADVDVFACRKCYAEHRVKPTEKEYALKRASVGALVEQRYTELGNEPFDAALSVTPAVRLTWRNSNECELDSTRLYVRLEDRDYRGPALSNPARFDPGGDVQAYGVEQSFVQSNRRLEGIRTPVDYNCERQGPFHRLVPISNWSYRVGYEFESRDTTGSEFRARANRLFAAGRFPFNPKWAVAAYAELAETDYSGPSAFDPVESRAETDGYAELAWERRLKSGDSRRRLRQSLLRVGGAWSRQDSRLAEYDFTRVYAFFGLEVIFGPNVGFIEFTPQTAGAQRAASSGSSGTSRPEVPTTIETNSGGG